MSSFFNKGGIILPKPSQVARTKIRNLYEDGYPGAAPRPARSAAAPIYADHEVDMTRIGIPHIDGPATGMPGAPCPDPANADPSDAPWSPDDCK